MATKSLKELLADWRRTKADMEKLMTEKLPKIIGVEAVRVVKDNFRLQGYDTGDSVQKWPKRNKRTDYRYNKRYGVKGATVQADAPIMDQTGDLKNSIDYDVINAKSVKIGVDLHLIPYAAIHNAGLMGKAWGKNPFRMTKRQYMPSASEGPNKKILKAIDKKVNFEIMQVMRLFKRR